MTEDGALTYKIIMKINKNQSSGVSALFSFRANPWAPKYEQGLWNDASQGAYELTTRVYKPVLEAAAHALGVKVDRPAKVADLLRRFSDNNLHLITGKPEAEIATMRGKFMHFLNTTAFSTNCYAYALNIRKGLQPGDLLTPGYLKDAGGECSKLMEGRSVSALFDGLAKDGLALFDGHPDRDHPPEGYYLAAVLVNNIEGTGNIKDFHFIRYDRDGGCSHKLGHGYVTRLNPQGQEIVDPTKAGAFGGYRYEGCIMVPAVLPQHRLMP